MAEIFGKSDRKKDLQCPRDNAVMQVREHDARGVRSEKWAREVVEFYTAHLAALPFEELFPEAGARASAAERARAYAEIGDTFANQPPPFERVAFAQYRRALREHPAGAPRVLRKMFWLYRQRRGASEQGQG